MRTKIECCRECERRYPGCHAECVDYAAENAELNEFRRKLRERRNAESLISEHITSSQKKRHIGPKLPKGGK